MPAILAPKDEERWLDPKLTKADIEELLRPFPAEQMDANMNNNNSQMPPKCIIILFLMLIYFTP